jgi:hypothetical protein
MSQPPAVDFFILQKKMREKREDGLRIARVKLFADLMVDKKSRADG